MRKEEEEQPVPEPTTEPAPRDVSDTGKKGEEKQ